MHSLRKRRSEATKLFAQLVSVRYLNHQLSAVVWYVLLVGKMGRNKTVLAATASCLGPKFTVLRLKRAPPEREQPREVLTASVHNIVRHG